MYQFLNRIVNETDRFESGTSSVVKGGGGPLISTPALAPGAALQGGTLAEHEFAWKLPRGDPLILVPCFNEIIQKTAGKQSILTFFSGIPILDASGLLKMDFHENFQGGTLWFWYQFSMKLLKHDRKTKHSYVFLEFQFGTQLKLNFHENFQGGPVDVGTNCQWNYWKTTGKQSTPTRFLEFQFWTQLKFNFHENVQGGTLWFWYQFSMTCLKKITTGKQNIPTFFLEFQFWTHRNSN